MPELPEVETIRRDLDRTIKGLKMIDVIVHDGRVIRNCAPEIFPSHLKDRTFKSILRQGKAIILELDKGFLVVQPMMTGQLIYKKPSGKSAAKNKKNSSDANFGREKSTKVTFQLSNGGYLNYNDHRLFGRLNWVSDLKEIKFLQTIGPDPFSKEFNINWLVQQFLNRKMPIKSLLMNQNVAAGIGNIYASEILFGAGINPKRAAKTLNPKEISLIYQKTIDVLTEAVALRGTSMNTYRDASGRRGNFINRIQVYGRGDENCFLCQRPIVRIIQAGRSTFYCKNCQPIKAPRKKAPNSNPKNLA